MIDRLTLNPKRVAAMADGIRAGRRAARSRRRNHHANGRARTACASRRCACPSASSASSTNRGRTSPATPPSSASRPATPPSCAAAARASHSNVAIAAALSRGCAKAGLPADAIQLIPVTDREAVRLMCEMDQYLDCIVPRGGKGLIETVVSTRACRSSSTTTASASCYVDQAADLAMAESIVINAKCQRPGVCNAIETVLVHRDDRGKILRHHRRGAARRKASSSAATTRAFARALGLGAASSSPRRTRTSAPNSSISSSP